MSLRLRLVVKTIGIALPLACTLLWLDPEHTVESVEGMALYPIVPPMQSWPAPLAVVVIALAVAAGEVVDRLRRLTESIRPSGAIERAGAGARRERDEIADLAAAIADATFGVRAQLAEIARREQSLRDSLAATMHDVMTPLTVLQGHLVTLRERVDLPTGGALLSAIEESHYLGALLHNLTVVAKLETGEPSVRRELVDLNALAVRAVARHRPIARQRGIDLASAVLEAPVFARADETLVEQAVSNLVYNAIVHNRRLGHVALTVEAIARDRFRVRVVDDGPGLPDPDRLAAEPTTMERPRPQLEGERAVEKRSGLGLRIAFRVARLHGFILKLQRSEYGGLQADLEGERSASPAEGLPIDSGR